MLKNFSKCSFVILLLVCAGWLNATARSNENLLPETHNALLSGSLTVTQVSTSTAYMYWTISGTAPYQVTVLDLTNSTLLTIFSTNNTTATIGGLTTGHTYRLEVTNSAETIIGELILS